LRISPWHEGVDIFGEVAICEADEEIAQIGVRFNAIHLGSADQAGEAGPVPTALVVPGKQRIAAVHGRAAYGVFDEVGVDVDAAIVQEEPEAILAFEHIGHGHAEIGLARDARGLRGQPGEELIHQWAGQVLADSPAMFGITTADAVFNLVEGGDTQQCLVDDRRTLLGLGLDQFSAAMRPAEGQPQRIAAYAFWRGKVGVAAIGINLDRAVEAIEDLCCIFAFTPRPIMEHHAGRLEAAPATLIA